MASAKKSKHKKRISKKGLPPGSSIYTGDKPIQKPVLSAITYNIEEVSIQESIKYKEIEGLPTDRIKWINIVGLSDSEAISRICTYYNLDSLTTEDILNTSQRPKSEEIGDYIFFTLRMLQLESEEEFSVNFKDEQISFILGKDFVLSFQEDEGDVFNHVRERIKLPQSRIRKNGPDFLVYALLDLIIDHYFEIVDVLNTKTEALEHAILRRPDESLIDAIQSIKFELIGFRRMIIPTREAISKLLRSDNVLIGDYMNRYLNDLQDHAIQVSESIDLLRELNVSQMEIYHSNLSLRMNRVMEALTIITVIFIPLTFIAGVYGMNFRNMPELEWKYGYFYALGFMALIVVGQIWYFKRKKRM